MKSGQSSDVAVARRSSPLAEYNRNITQMVVAAGGYRVNVCLFENDEHAILSMLRTMQHIYC
jgi:predicted RNA-binding protein associated with RNAse of E/G family